jgi:hypothetical protein
MKKLIITLIVSMTTVAIQAQVGFNDSLNGTSLANYTWIPLNNAGTGSSGTAISFDNTSGNGLEVDVANQAGTAVQGLYLNNTGAYLPIGARLEITLDWQTANTFNFGIAVGSSLSLTAASGDGSDVRNQTQYVFASPKTTATFDYAGGYDGTAGGLSSVGTTVAGTINTLAIERVNANTFNTYYDIGSGLTLYATKTVTTSSSVGDVIGFYADLRANGTPSLGYLSDLRIVAVPEPATMALTSLGGLLVLITLKRKKL